MAGDEHTVQVTAEELEVLRQWRNAVNDREAVIERVSEALRHPAIARLFSNWRNGVIILRIEFVNGRITYVIPSVDSSLKTGVEI